METRAARPVGQAGVRGRRRRAASCAICDRARRAGGRLRHPAQHRPRHPAVRRAGARDRAAATARPADRQGDLARPRRRTTRSTRRPDCETRVYSKTLPDGLRRRGSGVGAAQGAGRLGRGAGQQQRAGAGDGQLPDVRQPLDGSGISGTKYKQLFPSTNPDGTKIDPDQSILVNRAVQGNYNLGSTIKPFVAWSAMHAGIIKPERRLHRRGHVHAHHRSTRDDCQDKGGIVRCDVQERHQQAHGKPSSTARSRRETRWRSSPTRSSTASASSSASQRGPARCSRTC